jgi:hypothetical protein
LNGLVNVLNTWIGGLRWSAATAHWPLFIRFVLTKVWLRHRICPLDMSILLFRSILFQDLRWLLAF